MMRAIDEFILEQPEPEQSIFALLRNFIPTLHPDITEEWKYKLPFFYYKGKMFCYLWKDKRNREPYIGIVKGGSMNHPELELGDRKRMKILRINPDKDVPLDRIGEILQDALNLY